MAREREYRRGIKIPPWEKSEDPKFSYEFALFEYPSSRKSSLAIPGLNSILFKGLKSNFGNFIRGGTKKYIFITQFWHFFKGYGNCEFKRQFLDLPIFLGGGNIPLLYPLVIPDFGSNGWKKLSSCSHLYLLQF
jgi:hypothetical protein